MKQYEVLEDLWPGHTICPPSLKAGAIERFSDARAYPLLAQGKIRPVATDKKLTAPIKGRA